MQTEAILKSILFFLFAGLMEIGGGYLMWLWWREKWAWWVGGLGALMLACYGIIPTLQPANFGRAYAAYGGVFVVLSILWSWALDGIRPDTGDILGSVVCLIGVGFIMYTPPDKKLPES